MSKQIHTRFVGMAMAINAPLAAAFEHVGPIVFSRRRPDTELPELLCRAVAGQQLSTAAARTIWNRVLTRVADRELIAYLARCRPDTLRQCGMSAAKAKTLNGIARAARAGDLDADTLAKLGSEARIARLTALWGVGEWTAQMAAISYFRDRDVWPDKDVSARKTLESLAGSEDSAAEIAARFAPHRTYLAMYMWRFRDNPPALD